MSSNPFAKAILNLPYIRAVLWVPELTELLSTAVLIAIIN